MSNLLDVIRKNIEFVGISLLLMVIVFVIARASEVLIEKRNGVKFASKNTKVNKTVIMAMLSAIAVILMYFEFSYSNYSSGRFIRLISAKCLCL